MRILERSFYERNTQVVAFELIGKVLTLNQNGTILSGRIVETEAYFGSDDPASHAYRRVTARNQVMFGPAGVSYVYFTYGNHHCLNIVTEKEDTAGAVLVRALEPVSGIEVMRKRRQKKGNQELTNGPGKLTQAFGLTREHSGMDLTKGSFFLADGADGEFLRIKAAPRIGISRAKQKLLRFYLMDNPFVSVF